MLQQALINAVAVLGMPARAPGPRHPHRHHGRQGAEAGILFKNSEALERAGRLGLVVLDKTGTITRGCPAVTDIVLSGDVVANACSAPAAALLRLVARAERGSEHPLGEAIVAEA